MVWPGGFQFAASRSKSFRCFPQFTLLLTKFAFLLLGTAQPFYSCCPAADIQDTLLGVRPGVEAAAFADSDAIHLCFSEVRVTPTALQFDLESERLGSCSCWRREELRSRAARRRKPEPVESALIPLGSSAVRFPHGGNRDQQSGQVINSSAFKIMRLLFLPLRVSVLRRLILGDTRGMTEALDQSAAIQTRLRVEPLQKAHDELSGWFAAPPAKCLSVRRGRSPTAGKFELATEPVA